MSGRPKQPKYARNKNILVIGGSGSGKTRFFVKPNLMQMHSSYVVTDPKGTVLVECGKMLLKNGYKVKVLNTINFKKSMHYNPFAYIRSEKDILKLVNTIILNTKGEGQQSGEDFWVKAEKLYYTALIGYIWYECVEEEQNFTTLFDMINASEAREDDEELKNPVDLMFDELEERELDHLLYCADCGGKMYVHRTNNGKRISQYTCSQYSKVPVGKLCTTQHRINEDVVLSLVSEMLKAIAEYAKHDRAEFVRVVQEAQSSQQTTEVRKQRTRLVAAKQRVSELEVLLCKIYEDNILGKLSDSRYATLDAQYAKEQAELTAEISALEKAIKSYETHEKNADRFIALIDKYENFDKLTIAMLNEFIEKILVHERDRKGSIQTTQEVEIYFNFVGRFVPPAFGEVELTPEELEEIRKREERKDRLHQNYLKRKASGAQKRYEDKIKGRKKAEIEAKKAAIRAEDIAKGVFVPVSSLPQREPMKGVQTA